MRPVVTPEEMAAADRAAIAAGTPAAELMERAGHAVARAALRLSRRRYARRALVLAGKGNNGGDGFVAARVLAREGLSVRCIYVGDALPSSDAAAHHLQRMRAEGVEPEFFAGALPPVDVVVDALFGTGFRGAVEGAARDAIDALNDAHAPVVAVDIPSGVEGATGRVAGTAVHATVTVTMGAEKVGTALAPGAEYAGSVEVADIGISVDGARAWITELEDVRRVLPHRPATAHKRTSGSVAAIAGSVGMAGAALLTARGALRAGSGYVTLCSVAEVQHAAAGIPELLTRAVRDGSSLGSDAWSRFGDVVERADAVALGPGLGRGEAQRELVEQVLTSVEVPVVVDADALNALEDRTRALERRGFPTVITPHPTELARLLAATTDEIQEDRVRAARRAAKGFACVVLLKGYRTVIAEPSGEVVINPTGGPELATAGTGDVLTGVIAALIARGLGPYEASWAGAYLHGAAGEVAAERLAGTPLAGDVADALPEAVRRVRGAATGE